MALAGTGAICIWNGITPEGRADFYEWHIREHMPERAAIPGFLRGRRYIATTPDTHPEFFTLYETREIAVTTSDAYLARLNAPTPWTRRATAQFRDTSRALTRVVRSEGPGPGGLLATLRFLDVPRGHAAFRSVLSGADSLGPLAAMAQVTGVHLCTTDSGASAARTAESKDRADIQAAPIGAVLIEACTPQALRDATDRLAALFALAPDAAVLGFYRHEYTRLPADSAPG